MREFLRKLELIVITFIITATLCSISVFYFFIQYIQKDPIYKEAYDIVKEKDLFDENN